MRPITVLIPARNAGATIERALRSVMAQSDFPIVLVDDFSSDDTVLIARELCRDQLLVVQPEAHGTIGFARQTAIQTTDSPYAVWLDSDDEFLPERVPRMLAALRTDEVDIVCDGAELHDPSSPVAVQVLSIPDFLRSRHPLARLFERNYLPSIGALGVRVAFALEIGYDPQLHGAEDLDFMLRAIAAGGRVGLLDSVGYRIHAQPESLSRQLHNQRRMVRQCLRKHDYHDIRRLYSQAGYSGPLTQWGLISVAIYREEYHRALQWVLEIESANSDHNLILEPDGPAPFLESWRIQFHRGTLHLYLGQLTDSIACLEAAEDIRPSAEGANNLGVALAKSGRISEAREQVALASARDSQYLDANLNARSGMPDRITQHPLRFLPSRKSYSPDVL